MGFRTRSRDAVPQTDREGRHDAHELDLQRAVRVRQPLPAAESLVPPMLTVVGVAAPAARRPPRQVQVRQDGRRAPLGVAP